ncbi:MAG: SDR family NAD(P)-dependent oxidoreductase [Caulobacteraceae bacterium]|nr:SDR family NAD(P)-dependent oxidoreductase [Caulobacteraceae bacterium]
MQDFQGKVAVITGAAGLLGRSLAEVLAGLGVSIVAADINEDQLIEIRKAVEARGSEALCVPTDVSDPHGMEALADAAYERFGQVNLLCLNAGLAVLKPFEELTREDWTKVLSVQFGGVLNGVLAFLPRLIRQGGDRHIVNTSSMSGVGRADLRLLNAPYVTAKFAVVGLTEVMAPALAPHGIGVSVLCPGMTVSEPEASRATMPWRMPSAAWYQDNLLSGGQVAQEVVHGIRERRLYIFPHRLGRGEVEGRHAALMEGFAQAERTSPSLTSEG